MRANTDITRRLSFDAFANLYDDARPRFDADLTRRLFAFAHLAADAHVLDVGAGTGQWIDGLLDLGARVDALEPGDAMRTLLQERYGDRGVTVHAGDFEHFSTETRYDAIISSNAFHWVDPSVGYERAAEHLLPGGSVLFIWNFLALDDATQLQDAVRASLPALHQMLADILGTPDDLEGWLAEGRAELKASGQFDAPRHAFFEEPFDLQPRQVIDLLASYATDEPLTPAIRAASATRLAAELAPTDVASLHMRVYAVTAPLKRDAQVRRTRH